MNRTVKAFFALSFVWIWFPAAAQLHVQDTPWSFGKYVTEESFQHVSLAPPDEESLLDEDAGEGTLYKTERFAVLVPVMLDPTTSGTWVRHPQGQIWRLKLRLEGSLATSLYFEEFKLPDGVSLYLYDEDGLQLKGAYTSMNNQEEGFFATELIRGGNVILELNVPPSVAPGRWFTISEMTYGYAHLDGMLQGSGFGDSQFCEVNVNCSPEGDNYQDEKDGVVRIQVKVSGAAYWCSGSMVNNTSQDKTPYLLTADHCAYKYGEYATAGDLASWIFYFRYESSGCANPLVEPQLFSLVGCKKIAHDGTRGMDGSDFYLVKLLNTIPSNYSVYFNGWSRVDVPSSSGVTIHHPDGDIKKISTYLETPESSSWQGNGLPSHWEVLWAQTANNWGVTEGGSSGAPLFDNIGRIVGTLTGGLASCTNPQYPDYYGKFHYHWESNGTHDTLQLKPWLDPGNTGVLSLSGITLGTNEQVLDTGGKMHVYPNPAGPELFVEINEPGTGLVTVEVLDLLGKMMYRQEVDGSARILRFDLRECLPGIYFVRKSTPDGSVVAKIMKK